MDIFRQWKWEYMCGPAGLLPWDDERKDFGTCFQDLFLQIPAYFLLAIVSGYYVGYRKEWVVRDKTQERAILLRSNIVLCLVFMPIIELYTSITNSALPIYPVHYFLAGASCLSWLIHFGYVLALKHRLGSSSRGPLLQIFLWCTIALLNVISLRTNIHDGSPLTFDIITIVCHGVYFLTLLPSSNSRPTFYSPCLVGSQHLHSEYTPLLPHINDDILGTAMQGVGWLSKLTFSWVNPLFKKGENNKLNDVEELFDIPEKYRCSYVGARMDRALIGNVDHFQQFQEIPHEPFIASGYGALGESGPQTSTPVTVTSRVLVRPERRQNVTLLRALHSCFAAQFYSIGVLKLISDMAGFAGPLLLNKLVAFVQDDTIDLHYGYLYAGSLMAASLISAVFNVHFTWLMSIIGLKMRGAIVATILRKTLSVTGMEIEKSFTFGEITNFMSTDTDRIVNSCPSFHSLWSIPLQLFITLFLLYQQVGVSFLAGLGFSVILIPINKVIANKIGSLSTKMMHFKDSRVSIISDVLKGIRTIKMYVWEDYFGNKVSDARSQELYYLRGRKYLDAICVVLWATTPVLVAALTFGTHALRGQPLDAPMVFTTVALINMLIGPLNAFPWVLNGLTEAWVSIKRIQKFLDLPDMDPERYYDKLNTNRDEDKLIIFKNATFSWAGPSVKKKTKVVIKKNKGKSKKRLSLQRRDSSSSSDTADAIVQDGPFTLNNLSLEISRGDLIGITGPVGSGKTSLLLAIIGDMIKKSGDLQIPEYLDGFGYVPQKPWLVRGTIRDNILFGKYYDEAKFRSIVDACALTEDLNVLGWNAYVGEGGCTLSGGQKARISLARAVYQDKQVYLLDDIFSGLDRVVAAHIMQRCVLGLLKHTTRILVAHAPRHLAKTNTTVLLKDGVIAAQGPPDVILNDIEEYLPSDTESVGDEQKTVIEKSTKENDYYADSVSRNSLDGEETMSQGTVGWWVLGIYLKSVGLFLSISIFLSLVLMQLSQNFTFLWLTFWLKSNPKNSTTVEATLQEHNTTSVSLMDHGFNAFDKFLHAILNTSLGLIHNMGNTTDITENNSNLTEEVPLIMEQASNGNNYYLEVYFGLAMLNLVFTIMRAFLFAYGGVKAAKKIHQKLLDVIIRAKVKFFDITPAGRILNRFSSDTYTVDDSLPFILNILLAQCFSLLGAIAVTLYGIPWLSVALLPLVFIYYYLQQRYRITSRQLKRIQSVTLSPVYAHFNDTLEGVQCIRAGGSDSVSRWENAGGELVCGWQRAALCAAAASGWLALRLQLTAAALLATAAVIPVLQRDQHQPYAGLVGLAISYALSIASMLSNVLNAFTETEREMIAVERVGEYITQVEMEKNDPYTEAAPYGWPSQGVLAFEDVSLKYSDRDNSMFALQNVSFQTFPSEKLGVVGRTGAGKSSLISAIMRLNNPTSGRITLDGVDLASLELSALRSRIGVVPQEPFIFGGSVLENVDPLGQYSQEDVWRALTSTRLDDTVSSAGGLTMPAADLCRSRAQLLCLARAVLQRYKVLLVDEATASLDQDTERMIIDTVRHWFGGSTVIWVAHRMAGVMECERALVMSGGRAVELRGLHDALEDPTSHLYALVHAQHA